MTLRIAFMGTPEFAVPSLKVLLSNHPFSRLQLPNLWGPEHRKEGHKLVAVYTQPPRPKGRGHQLVKSAVHDLAEEFQIPVFTPETLKTPEARQQFKELNLDLAVVAAYGLLLPKEVLESPRLGCLNIHASLLPRWRGAAPIQRAIMAGDPETGICLMKMEPSLDTGPVYIHGSIPLSNTATAPGIHDRLSALGGKMLADNLGAIVAGKITPVPQSEHGVTYAHKLTKEEGKLDWNQAAAELDAKVRALNPWPGTECVCGGEKLKVLLTTPVAASGPPGTILDSSFTVACGKGALQLDLVQRPGRGPVTGEECLRGLHLSPGALLSAA